MRCVHGARRDTDKCPVSAGIADHDSACADDCTAAYCNALNNSCACADVDAFMQRYASRKATPCGNMAMRFDPAIVIDNGAGIDQDVIADPHACLHDCSCHHLYAMPHLNAIRNISFWVHDIAKFEPTRR